MGRERLRHHLPSGPFVAIALAFLLLFAALLVYFGAYDIADEMMKDMPGMK